MQRNDKFALSLTDQLAGKYLRVPFREYKTAAGPMRIAFVNFTGLRPSGSWTETSASMARALRNAGHELVAIEPSVTRSTLYLTARKAAYRVMGLHFHTERQHSIALELARSVERQLEELPWAPDLVLSSSSLPMAYLRTAARTAFWTDATFASMLGFYPEFSRLSRETIRSGMEVENLALARCDHAFYASEWAARSALADHRGDARKVHVVPFGPNLDHVLERTEVVRNIASRSRERLQLLYVGYDWDRKQGDLAMATRDALETLGIPTELIVVGREAKDLKDQYGLTVLGKLDKKDAHAMDQLTKALAEAHFLVVPSKAECYGMVYAEASAYGIPSVACNVGGVPTVVKDGVNGWLFDAAGPATTIAEKLARVWSDAERYQRMALSTRDHYDSHLDWSVCIAAMETMLRVREQRSVPA